MEKWKAIEGTDGRYEVSNTGKIRTNNWKNSGRTVEMKPAKDAKGYLRTMIIQDGRSHTIKVHREIAKAWIPNPEGLPQVNHINGDKTDNRVENLEWVDNKTNAHHAIENGLWESSLRAARRHVESQKKPVIATNLQTGETTWYGSVAEAQRATGATHASDVLKERRKQTKGYTFKYVK